jgi:hypothetical protein
MEMSAPEGCKHLNIGTTVNVAYIEDRDAWEAAIQIECTDCKRPFQFKGVQPGHSHHEPRCSMTAEILYAAIKPSDGGLFERATFDMSRPT